MSQRFRRSTHLMVIVSLVLCAWLFARGTNNLMMLALYEFRGTQLSTGDNPVTTQNDSPDAQPLSVPGVRPILERNIFSSKIGPILPGEPNEADTEERISDSPDEMPLVPCDGTGNKLLATVVSEESPDQSVAAISNGSEKALYHCGDAVGDRELLDISWRHIFLQGDADICYIDMFGEQNLQHIRKYSRRTHKTKIPRRFRKDVKQQGDIRIIAKKLIKDFAKEAKSYTRQMRLRPYKKNGEVVGYRVRRLSSKNPLRGMGLKRGDVIHEVNGSTLNSVSDAMGSLKSIIDEQRFTIAITRRGRPGTVKVAVR